MMNKRRLESRTSIRRPGVVATAMLLVLFTGTTLLAAASPSNMGTVDFTFQPCIQAKGRVFRDGQVSYGIWSGPSNFTPNWKVERSLPWSSGDPKPLHQTFSVPPGAYSYEVTATERHNKSDRDFIYCSQYFYVVVLPGSYKQISAPMYPGLADPIPWLFIYGLASPTLDVSVIRYPSNPKCGAALANLDGSSLALDRDAVGYYARDMFGPDHEKGAVFGIRVQRKGYSQSKTFRVVADYPDSIMDIVPSSARFDVTRAVLDAGAAVGGDTLLCP